MSGSQVSAHVIGKKTPYSVQKWAKIEEKQPSRPSEIFVKTLGVMKHLCYRLMSLTVGAL